MKKILMIWGLLLAFQANAIIAENHYHIASRLHVVKPKCFDESEINKCLVNSLPFASVDFLEAKDRFGDYLSLGMMDVFFPGYIKMLVKDNQIILKNIGNSKELVVSEAVEFRSSVLDNSIVGVSNFYEGYDLKAKLLEYKIKKTLLPRVVMTYFMGIPGPELQRQTTSIEAKIEFETPRNEAFCIHYKLKHPRTKKHKIVFNRMKLSACN